MYLINWVIISLEIDYTYVEYAIEIYVDYDRT